MEKNRPEQNSDNLIFCMSEQGQINEYIISQPEPKRSEMQELHRIILEADASL